MPHDPSQEFDFDLGSYEFDYDPFAEMEDVTGGEADESSKQQDPAKLSQGTQADGTHKPPADTRPASERIEGLFKEMEARRRTLLGLLRFLQEPRNADLLQAEVDRLQEHDYSVFTSADYASLLEGAGAIEKVSENGVAFDDDVEVAPLVIEVDGVNYLKPADYKETYWVNTAAGQAYLDADKPLDRFYELLEKEQKYEVIYKRVLTACSAEGGLKIAEITPLVDDDPLTQSPRMNAPHFVKCLEKCEALNWDGTWKITDIGWLCLERLADVADDYASPEPASSGESEE